MNKVGMINVVITSKAVLMLIVLAHNRRIIKIIFLVSTEYFDMLTVNDLDSFCKIVCD